MAQRIAVNNVINYCIGYPHGRWGDRTKDLEGADEIRLIELLATWRGEAVGGCADAIE